MDKRFIDQCEREELHLSGAIQAHGAMLVTDPEFTITHLSVNADEMLGDACRFKVGQRLPDELLVLAEQLGEETGCRSQFEDAYEGPHGTLDVVFSRNAPGDIIIEFTANLPCHEEIRPWQLDMEAPETPGELEGRQQALIARIFALTGFQRVMYYRFREDGDGEVLAEIRQANLAGTYLGLRFPASDIPQIARLLYLLNPWRLIPDAQGQQIPLLGTSQAPDLSYSDLRSVSPIHAIYLQNMGVRASLSFPIVVAGQLWGLVSCHHDQSRPLGLSALSHAAHEVKTHTMMLTSYLAQRRMLMIDGLIRRFGMARDLIFSAGDIVNAWPRLGEWLASEFAADGAQLCLDEQQIDWGSGFEPATLSHVDEWFTAQQGDSVWISETLKRQVPRYPLSQVSGMLGVKARSADGRMLRVYLTRHEHIHEVAWGGNPDKPIEHHDGQLGIAPRRSFEKWVEKRLGHCRPWDNEARLLGLKLRELLMQLESHA